MCKHTVHVCLTDITLADNVTWTVDRMECRCIGMEPRRSSILMTSTLSKYNVDHCASTGTSWDILNLVSLEGGLRIETRRVTI